jgi:hypothetical protein
MDVNSTRGDGKVSDTPSYHQDVLLFDGEKCWWTLIAMEQYNRKQREAIAKLLYGTFWENRKHKDGRTYYKTFEDHIYRRSASWHDEQERSNA